MSNLPTTTRGSLIGNNLPSSKDILSAFEVITTVEAAELFLARFKEKIKSTGVSDTEPAKDILAKITQFSDNIQLQQKRNSDESWSGKVDEIRTDFENLQYNLAEVSTSLVHAVVTDPIKLDIAFSDESELMRGFSTKNGPIEDKNTLLALDNLLNAWFAEQGVICRDSSLYDVTPEGEVKKNQKGEPIKANIKQIAEMMSDPRLGFIEFLSKRQLQAELQQHRYPKAQAQKAPQSAEQISTQETVETQAEPNQEVTPTVGGQQQGM